MACGYPEEETVEETVEAADEFSGVEVDYEAIFDADLADVLTDADEFAAVPA